MVKIPHWPLFLGKKPINLGLSRMLQVMEVLNNPHRKIQHIIHISGTNGKGSTLAFLQGILVSAGYSVDKYTSPHLVEFNERIVLSGQPIGDDYLYEILEKCKKAQGNIELTFFEGTTVAAFVAFSESDSDVLLLETGLGGRLDATNICEAPLATIIAPVSLDHTDYLGDTIEKIAFEKAGIIKEGVPVIVSKQNKAALDVIKRVAAEKNAPVYAYGEAWHIDGNMYRDEQGEVDLSNLALKGSHQCDNAALAVAAFRHQSVFNASKEQIEQGLSQAKWPGRLQEVVIDGQECILDGGHNPDAARVQAEMLAQSDKPNVLIWGMMERKDCEAYIKTLAPQLSQVITTNVNVDGAMSADALAKIAGQHGLDVTPASTLSEALQYINENAAILIAGSLFLVGEALELSEKIDTLPATSED